jgi:hypothetical protein
MWTRKASSRAARIAILVILAALCIACSTAAQRKEVAIRNNSHLAIATLNACIRPVYESQDFAPLRSHIPAPPGQFTLEQLTDTTFATDDEIKAFFAVHPKVVACRQQYLDVIVQETPTFVPPMASFFSRTEDALIGLIRKKTTWGDYIRQVKTGQEELRAELVSEGRMIDANLARSNEMELARRQAAANAIAHFVETAAEINALNRPVVTTCNAYGNSATCITR